MNIGNLAKEHELFVRVDLKMKAGIVPAVHYYNVRRNLKGDHAVNDVFVLNDLKDMAKVLGGMNPEAHGHVFYSTLQYVFY